MFEVRAPLFRYLNVSTGAWQQRDIAGYVDGGNLYQYVSSEPMDDSDPTGTTKTYDDWGPINAHTWWNQGNRQDVEIVGNDFINTVKGVPNYLSQFSSLKK